MSDRAMKSAAPSPIRPYWPPLAAGVALGLALVLAYAATGHGLGASGFFARLAAGLAGLVAPAAAEANSYFGPYLRGNPLAGWISWEIVGVLVGALAGSLASGRFRLGVERGAGVSTPTRIGLAFLGGILTGFGSRLARGCTSGLGLSGGATLSVAAFVFLFGFFAMGFATMVLMRRVWK